MSRPAQLSPAARAEAAEAVSRVAEHDTAAARRLRAAIVDASRRIGARPLLGRVEPALARPQYRFWSLPAFSLLLVYDATTDPVQILRVVHTARDLPKVLRHLGS